MRSKLLQYLIRRSCPRTCRRVPGFIWGDLKILKLSKESVGSFLRNRFPGLVLLLRPLIIGKLSRSLLIEFIHAFAQVFQHLFVEWRLCRHVGNGLQSEIFWTACRSGLSSRFRIGEQFAQCVRDSRCLFGLKAHREKCMGVRATQLRKRADRVISLIARTLDRACFEKWTKQVEAGLDD